MKTWHYIVIGGVVLFLWSRNKRDDQVATTPPEQGSPIVASLSGLEAQSRAAFNLFGLRSDRRFG